MTEMPMAEIPMTEEPGAGITAAGFDEGYRRGRSPGLRRLWEQLDPRLPAEVEPFSFVSVDLLATVAAELTVGAGQVLVDLGCGRGGPGLWLAERTGAALIGVDFSAVAIEHATARAAGFGRARAEFRVGDLAATGLADQTADAVVSIDALHFAPDLDRAAAEIVRLLRPGGRLVVTTWQPHQPGDPRLPARLRHDWPTTLARAGLRDVTAHTHPDWQALHRRLYELALAAGDPGEDASLAALQAEARARLRTTDLTTRTMFTATTPPAASGRGRAGR
jgi:SAM-dependent methyltransferase